ncbi:MAG: tetrahydromethanopterin S-methyltransferase subunit B [Methanosarcinaceae archaeon]|nr:tetrahydromethanopterin S-methyltransferase subunit B [Methanosarcinaceae archaeon]MDD4332187.1 tetrahydromethanopterin S-methyltransferase subunit B [Methanosarcinaceae archaeon]MDD4749670.1 tetrahydromethanopterin S-methyltransferase subunit B [Methanosarcinaceae archaeon]
MSVIRIAPEVHLVMDPETSLVAEEREDVIAYSMEPVFERLDKLDAIADDLVNSLAPDMPLLNSWPGREKTSLRAGIYSNAFYGLIIGLAFSGLLALIMYIRSLLIGVI